MSRVVQQALSGASSLAGELGAVVSSVLESEQAPSNSKAATKWYILFSMFEV